MAGRKAQLAMWQGVLAVQSRPNLIAVTLGSRLATCANQCSITVLRWGGRHLDVLGSHNSITVRYGVRRRMVVRRPRLASYSALSTPSEQSTAMVRVLFRRPV